MTRPCEIINISIPAIDKERQNIDYGSMSRVRRVKYYRSPDRDRPLDEWELVPDNLNEID